jgi:monovalent cation/proton antiporter MnhG/PhaG subunit
MGRTLVDVLAAVLLGLGLLLATVGLIGLLRMPRIFDQLHAAGLVTGPAVVLVLAGSVATRSTEIVTSAALVALFVLITSPLSAHVIGQAARRRPSGEPAGETPPGDESG